MADTSFTALKSGYTQCYQNCIINSSINDDPGNVATAISNNMSRYFTVSNALATKFPAGTPIPWYVIGFIHKMESDMNFGTHLHNGDPLTARTVHVPTGRPVNGNPPFTWEDSAADALQLAAALEACEQEPHGYVFVTADQRLAQAARQIGFSGEFI